MKVHNQITLSHIRDMVIGPYFPLQKGKQRITLSGCHPPLHSLINPWYKCTHWKNYATAGE